MRNQINKFSFWGIIILAGAISLSGCASYTSQHVEQNDISSYVSKVTVAGVVMAADGIDSAAKTKSIFTVDTGEKDFVPVEVIIKNNSDRNLLVESSNITLTDSAGNTKSPVKSDVVADNFEHNKLAEAFFGFGILSYAAAEDANKKMRQDWEAKSFPDNKTLLANSETRGYLFFKTNRKNVTGSTFIVKAKDLKTNKMINLAVKLQSSSVR